MKTTSPLLSASWCTVNTLWWHNSFTFTCCLHTTRHANGNFKKNSSQQTSSQSAGRCRAAGRLWLHTAGHRGSGGRGGRGRVPGSRTSSSSSKQKDWLRPADPAPLWRGGWAPRRYRTARSKGAGFFRGSVPLLQHAFNQSRGELLPLRTQSGAAPPPVRCWHAVMLSVM